MAQGQHRAGRRPRPMFEQTLTLLLAGELVCAVRYPDAWRFLEDEASR